MTRFALGLEYDGTAFSGWQTQKNLPPTQTVQGSLEKILSRVADAPVTLHCAGRTDARVHAVGQVIHFDTDAVRTTQAFLLGANSLLPKTIAVQWVQIVDENFHARFSALSRHYRYFIYNAPVHSAIYATRATWCRYPLDADKMHMAAQFLCGEQDFSAFRSSQCGSLSPFRHLQKITIVRMNQFVVMDVVANAFLHHMVRNIAGTLFEVGIGRQPPEWVQAILQGKDRRLAAPTAAPEGLYLYEVAYPAEYSFPKQEKLIIY